MSNQLTFLCIATYFKGADFLIACKKAGNKVFLLTNKKLENEAWPREAIDEFFYLESNLNTPDNLSLMAKGLAYLVRSQSIDRIVALDDFDVEKGAYLREQFRIPGMGQTTVRHFRDKLAMRMKAQASNILVPPFTALFNDDAIHRFTQEVAAPWVVKPRSEASAVGIKKVYNAHELWQVLNELGNDRHQYLVEQFKPGDVYHADALCIEDDMVFCRVSRYVNTPFEVAHGGGVFRSRTVPFGEEEDQALQAMNARLLKAFGLKHGASHSEYIRAKSDGRFYFLETASRVGGANIAEMVDYSSGINLWAEWANIENALAKGLSYELPTVQQFYAGIIVSLSRFEHPDTTPFNDPEIVWRMDKAHHIGLIVQSQDSQRIAHLLDDYAERILRYYHASLPPKDSLFDE